MNISRAKSAADPKGLRMTNVPSLNSNAALNFEIFSDVNNHPAIINDIGKTPSISRYSIQIQISHFINYSYITLVNYTWPTHKMKFSILSRILTDFSTYDLIRNTHRTSTWAHYALTLYSIGQKDLLLEKTVPWHVPRQRLRLPLFKRGWKKFEVFADVAITCRVMDMSCPRADQFNGKTECMYTKKWVFIRTCVWVI